jgi:hypothetical protein
MHHDLNIAQFPKPIKIDNAKRLEPFTTCIDRAGSSRGKTQIQSALNGHRMQAGVMRLE